RSTLLGENRSDSGIDHFDSAYSVAADAEGNVVVTGYISDTDGLSDIRTEKYDGATGALLWQTNYNDTFNADDGAGAIALDAHNNVIVTGYSGSGISRCFYTVKYAAAGGAILWEQESDKVGVEYGWA